MGKTQATLTEDTISLYSGIKEEYSPQYVRLVRDFYLWA